MEKKKRIICICYQYFHEIFQHLHNDIGINTNIFLMTVHHRIWRLLLLLLQLIGMKK